MRLCACDCNRLHLVRLIKPVAEFCISGSFARFVAEFLRFLRCSWEEAGRGEGDCLWSRAGAKAERDGRVFERTGKEEDAGLGGRFASISASSSARAVRVTGRDKSGVRSVLESGR